MTHLDPRYIGDGIERPRIAFKWNAQLTGARRGKQRHRQTDGRKYAQYYEHASQYNPSNYQTRTVSISVCPSMISAPQSGILGDDARNRRGTMTLLPLLLAIEVGEGDAELVKRLQRRESGAMAELYDRYGRLVYALILRVVRDGGIAEDLVQETFLRVWNRVQGFDAARGALGPWLLAVARNRAIDYLRSAGGRMQNALELEETERPAVFVDFERQLVNSDRVRRVKVALQKLSENQRSVIELAYFEGLSQTEMAERMGQPLGTVKTWVRAALKSLRDELGTAVPA